MTFPTTAGVLHLEDSDLDAELIRDRLERSGLPLALERVADRPAFVARLAARRYDLILSDYQVPGFDGPEALELARAAQPGVPFVFVSGALGEEVAVETLRRGATDYVLKERLARLGPAVERALAEAHERAERQRAEADLRDSEARLRVALTAGRMGTWALDLATGRMECSDTCRANYGRGPGEPFNYDDLAAAVLDDDRPGWRAAVADAVERAADFAVEYRTVWPDGSVHWVHVRGSCATADGRVVALSGVSFDVTDRQRAEQALRDADRRKDEFLATLAHELRNPLAPIRNALHVVKLSADRAVRERAWGTMERQLGQMVRLIDDLLDVSRISRGKLALRRERVELAAVVGAAAETVRPLVDRMGHDLAVELPDRPVWLDADPTRLAQVFMNLLNNAAKYSEPGGRIRLTATPRAGEVEVVVKDGGIGIPADKLNSIFDLFAQVDDSLEKAQGGLGIGLSLVKRLAELHGGTVEARSDGPGRGSEFVVRLPVAAPPPPARSPARGDAPAPEEALRILVADDNRDAADSLAEMLTLLGHDTRTAYDGEEAVAAADAFRPDVVVLDIGMPKLNGRDACRRIRGRPWGAGAVLVAVSGWGQEDDLRRSRDAGFDRHLVKPVDPAALLRQLAGLQPAGR